MADLGGKGKWLIWGGGQMADLGAEGRWLTLGRRVMQGRIGAGGFKPEVMQGRIGGAWIQARGDARSNRGRVDSSPSTSVTQAAFA